MTKDEMMGKAKLIGLRALEDVVKEIGIPYLELKVSEGNSTAKVVYTALKTTIAKGVDSIDGEEG